MVSHSIFIVQANIRVVPTFTTHSFTHTYIHAHMHVRVHTYTHAHHYTLNVALKAGQQPLSCLEPEIRETDRSGL